VKKKKQQNKSKIKTGKTKIAYIGDYFKYRCLKNSYDHFLYFDYEAFRTLSKISNMEMSNMDTLSIITFYQIEALKNDMRRII
jgi:hypothetical protein